MSDETEGTEGTETTTTAPDGTETTTSSPPADAPEPDAGESAGADGEPGSTDD